MLHWLKDRKAPQDNLKMREEFWRDHHRQNGRPFRLSSASAGDSMLQYVAAVVYQIEPPLLKQMGAFFHDRKLVKWADNSASPCGGYLAAEDRVEGESIVSDWPKWWPAPKWLNGETYGSVIRVEDWSTAAAPCRWLVIVDECYSSHYAQVTGFSGP